MLLIPFVGDVAVSVQRRGHRRRNYGGRRRWAQKASGAAGQVRSEIAHDRRRGAEAGKRPALRARALFSAVTVVPRVYAPPRRPSLGFAGVLSNVGGLTNPSVRLSCDNIHSCALAFFYSARKHRGRREKHALQRRPLRRAARYSKHVYRREEGRLNSGTRAGQSRQVSAQAKC